MRINIAIIKLKNFLNRNGYFDNRYRYLIYGNISFRYRTDRYLNKQWELIFDDKNRYFNNGNRYFGNRVAISIVKMDIFVNICFDNENEISVAEIDILPSYLSNLIMEI